MHILNLVDTVEQINYGIWNTVTTLFPYLKEKGCEPEIWFPAKQAVPDPIQEMPWRHISDKSKFEAALSEYPKNETIVISHGLWKEPTFWGATAKKMGYPWVVIPHGMLEPWSMRHKWWKKLPYYNFVERNKITTANAYIAVGLTEYYNLKKHFSDKVHLLTNGIKPVMDVGSVAVQTPQLQFVFMSRLHHKKGVLPLVEGWLNSHAFRYQAKLNIIGPDEGEQDKIVQLLSRRSSNINTLTIRIPGPAYGDEKARILKNADFFILPSFSEGFPTAVLEAMSYGCIPIISDGCNFPQAFESNIAIKVEPKAKQIMSVLNDVFKLSPEDCSTLKSQSKQFVDSQFSLDHLSDDVMGFYQDIIEDKV